MDSVHVKDLLLEEGEDGRWSALYNTVTVVKLQTRKEQLASIWSDFKEASNFIVVVLADF